MKILHGLGVAAALLMGTAASQPAAAFPANLASCQVGACSTGNSGLVQQARSKGQWRHGGHGGHGWHGGWNRHRWHGHRWGGGGFGFYPGYYGFGSPYGVYGYDPYDYGYGYGDGYSIWSEVDPSVDADGDYGRQASSDYIRYCSQKYRSFNPSTGMYRTYSGQYKRCAYPG